MKKTILLAGMMLATVCTQAQLIVNEDGHIGIAGITSNNYLMYSVSTTPILGFVRAGAPQSTGSSLNWTKGIDIWNLATNNHFNIGIKGYSRAASALNTGRAYGVWGEAGNTTSGYNYGIYGYLYGSQNGAAVYGTLSNDNGINVGGRYAGYFNGDVKVTGSLYASVVTSTAASASIATGQVTLAENNATSENVSDKLAQLSAVQYNLNIPTTLASTSTTFATRVNSDTLSTTTMGDTVEVAYPSDIELQALSKNHYGLMAAQLQQIYPDLVYENQQGDLCINYIEMIPLLVESIKELKAEIATLQGGNGGGAVVMSRAIPGATDIEEATALTIPMLKQNNPNPFTENTVIEYVLPETVQSANLYIYDMNGTQIEQIPLTERGESSVTVNGGQLAAGMYLYSLIADGKVIDTKRMILTK